ncbi:hypothetical protein LINPERHAP2_LOCUS19779 [Linum perenne]
MAIAFPLVFMLPNSSCLLFPGNWKSSPGVSSTNSTTPIKIGPQSAINEWWNTKGKSLEVKKEKKQTAKRYGY